MSSSCSLCPAKQFLASLGLPPSTVESVSHFITPEESSEHQPSWALKGDSNLKCSCARQTPLDSRLPINAWAESIFAIIKHLHSVIMQAAVDEGELIVRECRIWEYFARGDFDRLCKTMSQLVNHCTKTILISHLDQTFTMSYIQTSVDCLCKEEYVLPPLEGAQNEVNSARGERNDARRALRLHSQQALLLLKLLHAVTSVTCVTSEKETVQEGHSPSPTPVWLSCSWQSCSRNLLILENHEGGLRDDAISLRPAPKKATPPAPVSRSVSSATKKKRRVLLDSIDGGKVTTSDHPGEPATAKRPRRGRGIPRVPPEVQLIILSFLPPRHIVTADATCHTWKYLIESDCNTRTLLRVIVTHAKR
ncbi:unnamed protein product [Bodo saltans]|uniref:F-box domain-containing protein n=1 Tax=Bodo saltans TaxID=75058 RepID=A0A0S4JQJ4_BODSA|nr:unnamed protein product [Bodo saltans]|eukprot:CUG92527.1 unnamed protein product [Bodo saltans]